VRENREAPASAQQNSEARHRAAAFAALAEYRGVSWSIRYYLAFCAQRGYPINRSSAAAYNYHHRSFDPYHSADIREYAQRQTELRRAARAAQKKEAA